MKKRVSSYTILLLIFTVVIGCSNKTNTETVKNEENLGQDESEYNHQEAEAQINTDTMSFKASPYLTNKDLESVDLRLPKEPKITNENPRSWYEDEKPKIGKYGGKLRMISPDINFNPDLFIMLNEALLNTPGILGEKVTGNIVKNYEVSNDQKEFTFFMREGLKWSDGEPVTTDDVLFAYEDVMKNEELTPVFPALFRAGGTPDGEPMQLEIIDQYTFKLKFSEPYGGILMRLTISGWLGTRTF
jgi:peptide/nickel transport system substrate-binding protein